MTAKTKKLLTTCACLFLVALVLLGSTITASASSHFPQTVTLTNPNNVPFAQIGVAYSEQSDIFSIGATFGAIYQCNYPTRNVDNEIEIITIENGAYQGFQLEYNTIPDGSYYAVFMCFAEGSNAVILPYTMPDACGQVNINGNFGFLYLDDNTDNTMLVGTSETPIDFATTIKLLPIDNGDPPADCPTLEELIADYDGHWYSFDRILQAYNPTLYTEYIQTLYAWLEDGKEIGYEQGFEQGFDEGHLEGYTEGFNAGLNGGANRDPIDQYWNSTKDYILIAGQPYFAPNGFGSIDQYNTVGIYGEHESKLHRADGTTQTFNGQYVTQFASAGTLGGGWYKIGSTVGDANAYEQSITVETNDKAYYVSRVSPLGDPVEEFLVAIWVDGYEAWYVAEEYAHAGTVANNNKSYKQVYSIYMTDIRPTAQRFVNYDNPTLHETFNEDINATLYLATFNQLNNYNVYTDDIGIVESYNNGFDAGANTTLWTDLISQPIVAFFSIPLAQVIIEGVTYTLTYGIVLGAGIVGLIVMWFLKLFAGG